jgi:hypothetical protein
VRALFWTKDGPGEREVPDYLPPVIRVATFSLVVSRRGDAWTRVGARTFHRQLYAAPLGDRPGEFADWVGHPAARVAENPKTRARVLLMPVYTEWAQSR